MVLRDNRVAVPLQLSRPEQQIKKPRHCPGLFSRPLPNLFCQQARELSGRAQAANFIDPPGQQNRASFERFDFLLLRVSFLKFCNLLVEDGQLSMEPMKFFAISMGFRLDCFPDSLCAHRLPPNCVTPL